MEMNIDDYLRRINYQGGREPTEANLVALARAHRFTVPYDTLDIWNRHHTTLATEEIYDKIVTRRRGGYCFELNGLFAWLLRELGYNVREYSARWILGEDMAVPKRRHRVICVALPSGANKIVDVGIGMGLVITPLDFVFNIPQPHDNKLFRIVRDPVLTCVVQAKKSDGTWANLFSFDTAPQLPIDFSYAHWWCETHPDSPFLKNYWAVLPLPDGGIRAITREPIPETGEQVPVLALFRADGEVEKTVLHGKAALQEALREHFGITEDVFDPKL